MTSLTPRFARYQVLTLTQHGPTLEAVMDAIQSANRELSTTGTGLYHELAEIWRNVSTELSAHVVLIRGEGRGFSTGSDPYFTEQTADDFDVRACVWYEARDPVHNVINCNKPAVSTMHGPTAGAGLVVGLLADTLIATRDARTIDGHTCSGVAADDHVAIVWPLLYGIIRARHYLLLCESMTGEEAEHIGLISLAVPESELVSRAFEVVEHLTADSQTATRWTKHALNNWLHLVSPSFDTPLAPELMGSAGPDTRESIASLCQKHPSMFDGA